MNLRQDQDFSSRKIIIILIYSMLAISFQPAAAQVIFKNIDFAINSGKNHRVASTARDSTRLTLPFWDDFSRTTYMPDTNHWFIDPGTAIVTSNVGISPPTVNVATFDGWNNMGIPYSNVELEQGAGDSLVSRFIDLSNINPALFQTGYISFFWQKEGRGEMPDDTDSIRLQVIDVNKRWVTIWSKSGRDETVTNQFFQEIIQVGDPSYYHNYFQFRFQSFGRLSGGYDSWHIDYVYLNINRNSGDLAYEDRALVSPPSSWLTRYAAMPYDHFLLNLESNLQPTTTSASNLDSQVQPIEFYAQIRNETKIFDEMNQGTPQNLAPKTISTLVSQPINPDAFDKEADTISLILETKFFITSGDSANWLNKYDLRVNDTTRSTVMLDKELAYDDGTAEWAAGLSQKAAILAYRFVIPKADIITALKIYFPQFAPASAGKSFTLVIWGDIYQYRQGRLLTEQHIVQQSTKLNEFTTYNFGRPVVVRDTFYVGYEQSIADFFPVGLDKSGIIHEGNIFINLDGVWEPASTVDGNLMIRPVFGFESAVGLEEEIFKDVKVYPNPSAGVFNISGQFEKAWIFDIMGNEVLHVSQQQHERELRLMSGKGIYLVKILKEGKYKTFKLVIQ
jgi:hypothetical protein